MAETVYRQLLSNPGWDVMNIADYLRIRELDVRRAMKRLGQLSLVLEDPVSKKCMLPGLMAT